MHDNKLPVRSVSHAVTPNAWFFRKRLKADPKVADKNRLRIEEWRDKRGGSMNNLKQRKIGGAGVHG